MVKKHLKCGWIRFCFDNIVIPDDLVEVTYMHISMVDAQLTCLRYLTYNYQPVQWKYANILCGKELPFNSNRVMVDTLSKLFVYHVNHPFRPFFLTKVSFSIF